MPSSDGTLKPMPSPVAVVVDAERVRRRARDAGRVQRRRRLLDAADVGAERVGPPFTPRLNEPMSRRNRFRYCAPIGAPNVGGRRRLGEDLGRRPAAR